MKSYLATAMILILQLCAFGSDVPCPYPCSAQPPVDTIVGTLPAGLVLDILPQAPTPGQAHLLDSGQCVQCPNPNTSCKMTVGIT